jgi:hypothetical protein
MVKKKNNKGFLKGNNNLIIGFVAVLLLVGVFLYFNTQKQVRLSPDLPTINLELKKGWNLVNLPLVWELFEYEDEKGLYDKEILAAFVYYKKIEEYVRLHPFREIDNVNEWYEDVTNSKNPSIITGESVALFSGETKLYANDDLNKFRKILTKSDFSAILADGNFAGNVDTSMTQKINIGSNPKVTFKKQPTSTDNPNYALTLSTVQANSIYSTTVNFNKAVDFTHADSEGEDIELFGKTYTIGSETDEDTLVLLEHTEKLTLDNDNPKTTVNIEGSFYTVELVSTSDTAATVKITRDSMGYSESKEINEAQSKTVQGVTVAVIAADETNLKFSATIIVGSNKLTLEDSSSVTSGEDDTIIDGTLVDFEGTPVDLTEIKVNVYAPEADLDALKPGETYTDPVFGTFKLDFTGFNIAEGYSSSRETISLQTNGDDKLEVSFTDHRGNAKTFQFAKDNGIGPKLLGDDHDRKIVVKEEEVIQYQEYVVVGNEDEGYYLQLSAVKNAASGISSDKVEFKDIFTGDIYKTSWISEGIGVLNIGGKSYEVSLKGAHTSSKEDYEVRLNYPDSLNEKTMIVYPTIETSLGAKVMFYKPLEINLNDWDGNGNKLSTLIIPDGDGYTEISFQEKGGGVWVINGEELDTTAGRDSVIFNVGVLKFNLVEDGNRDKVHLIYVRDEEEIWSDNKPRLILLEEKDSNNEYNALIVNLEEGSTTDDGIGIDTIKGTWDDDIDPPIDWSSIRYSDSKLTDIGDLWGSVITVDAADSDQKTATISYPDEQIYAQIYMSEVFEDFNNDIDPATLYSSMWIYSNKDQTLKLSKDTNLRKELENLDINDVALQSGWNFGSITNKMTDNTWESVKGTCNTKNPGFVDWNEETQNWEIIPEEYLKNIAFKNSELYSGFVIRIDEKCNLGNTFPDIPNLPLS